MMAGCALFDRSDEPPKPEDSPRVSLRFHLAIDQETEGYDAAKDEGGRPLYVAPSSFLTERDVWNATVYASERRYLIELEFTPGGALHLQWATEDHVGQRLAIYVDDELVMTPIVPAPITQGRLFLDGEFSKRRAEKLAGALNAQRGLFGPLGPEEEQGDGSADHRTP